MHDTTDLDQFCNEIRDFVFEKSKSNIAIMLNLSESELESPEKYVSKNETKLIVDEYHKKHKLPFPQEVTLEVCNCLKRRMFSNILSNLAASGLVDCAYSDEENDFIFKPTQKGVDKGIVIPQRP